MGLAGLVELAEPRLSLAELSLGVSRGRRTEYIQHGEVLPPADEEGESVMLCTLVVVVLSFVSHTIGGYMSDG